MRLQITVSRPTMSAAALAALLWLPGFAFAQASPFMTGATALQTNILAWLTPVAIILVMVLGGMAMANRMLKSLAARIVFAPKDYPDAREISDELGFTTVKARTLSRPAAFSLEGRGRRSRSLSISEQRRALLLPQEVKELGTEEAIVFYEGLRPIRCRKIRYFSDPRLRRRLLPPPASSVPAGHGQPFAVRPSVDRLNEATGPGAPVCEPVEGPGETPATTPTPTSMKEKIVTREGTAADLARIETLQLSDYAIDFSKVFLPDREGPLSAEEIDAAAGKFVDLIARAWEV